MSYHRFLETVKHCEAIFEFTEYPILQMEGSRHRREQLRLLRDCADICTLTHMGKRAWRIVFKLSLTTRGGYLGVVWL